MFFRTILNISPSGASLHKDKYRPDIDGIRALAVIFVVVHHAFPNVLPGGFVGVDIFFVISGYLISQIIFTEVAAGRFSFLEFYNRRARRIFPALIVVLGVTAGLGWITLFSDEFSILGRHILASAFFVENIYLWSEAGYFDMGAELKPTLHLWSLSIEEQFYIFWPIIVVLFFRNGAIMLAALVLILVGSFIINLSSAFTDAAAAYYSILSRSWELLIGGALAYFKLRFHGDVPKRLVKLKWALSVSGMGLILFSLVLISPESRFPGYWALLPTLGTALLLSAGETGWVNRRILTFAPLVWVGLISYPLYLWHWPFLSYTHILFGSVSFEHGVMSILAALIAATLTFHFVEKPFRRRDRTIPVWPLVAGMGAAVLAGGMIYAHVLPGRLDTINRPLMNEFSYLNSLPQTDADARDSIHRIGEERKRQVLFIGDSHLAHYTRRIGRKVENDDALPGAIYYASGGCLIINTVTSNDLKLQHCAGFRDKAFASAENPQVSTVVIAGAWNLYFIGDVHPLDYAIPVAGKSVQLSSQTGRRAALDQLASQIRYLEARGKTVYLILDNPTHPDLSPRVRKIRRSINPSASALVANVAVPIDQVVLRNQMLAWAQNHGIFVIDPVPTVCPDLVCPRLTDSMEFLYIDPHHLNPNWADLHADFLDVTLN